MLTEPELRLVDKLGECTVDFGMLDVMHTADLQEFMVHIHALQNIVMARAAMRSHPERFGLSQFVPR